MDVGIEQPSFVRTVRLVGVKEMVELACLLHLEFLFEHITKAGLE